MASAVPIVDLAIVHGQLANRDLTAAQEELWDRHVGDDAFWEAFEAELPGFLRAMLPALERPV